MQTVFTFFSVSALINMITSFGFAGYLFSTERKKRIARYLIYMCLSLGTWSLGYFMWQIAPDADSALFWSRGLMFGAIFTSISFLHLALVFLKLDRKKKYKILLAFFYLCTITWVIANFTPYFVTDVRPRLFFPYWPSPGPFYHPFLFLFGVHVLMASGLLFRKFLRSTGKERKQALLLCIGTTLTFVGGSTNYFLWYDIPIAPWGNGLASIYVVLTVYAMLKYRLIDAKVIAAELFAGTFIMYLLMDAILSMNNPLIWIKVIGVMFAIGLGSFLIRSVRGEVNKREEIAAIAASLEKANLQLKELDKQKTEFLSIASHQLRTPLSIIKGYIELLMEGAFGKVTKKTKDTLRKMDESNERLVVLVDEFLNITRIEQGRTKYSFEQQDLTALTNSVLEELMPKAAVKDLKLVWKQKKKTEVCMDADKVRHVVFNYIDNAIKYTPKGKITISIKNDKKGYFFTVKDTGFGFTKEEGAGLFQKFYRAESVKTTNVNGTGLGIYVCRKFIEAHDGKVWADSEGLKKGSTFGFWIPAKGPKKKNRTV